MFPHADEDRAAASFRRAHDIRQAGVKALMGLDARRRVATASRARVGTGAKFNPGQWVYVWRKTPSPGTQYYRGRWVGPGVVIMHEKSVYVLVGKRMWKAATEQVRPATRDESMGAELVLQDGRFQALLR